MYSTRLVKFIVVVLHIYGAKAILPLFCDYQDTESESPGMEIGVARTICTLKISEALLDNDIYTPQDGFKILCKFFIFMEIELFFYFFVITTNLNLFRDKCKLVYLYQYSPRKISRSLWYNYIYTPQDWSKIL